MRQAGTWDHLLQCLHLDKCFLQQQNTKKYKGLNNCIHAQLGQLRNNKIQKDQKPNHHFWGVGSKSSVLHMILAHTTTKGVGRPPKPPSGLTLDLPLPSSHLRDQLSPPPAPGSKQGNLLLVFSPSCCSTSPSKALPEFHFWPLINFYWLKSLRTQVSNTLCCDSTGMLPPPQERIWGPPGPPNAASPWVTSGHLHLLFQSHYIE